MKKKTVGRKKNRHHASTQRKRKKPLKTRTTLESAGRRQTVYNIIHQLHTLKIKSLREKVEEVNIHSSELKSILKELEQKGLIYSPKPGVVGCVDD